VIGIPTAMDDRLSRRRRTVDRCPSCGRPVLVDDDFATEEGRVYHVACLPEKVEERTYRQLYQRPSRRPRIRPDH
jgi:hypothetical protein